MKLDGRTGAGAIAGIIAGTSEAAAPISDAILKPADAGISFSLAGAGRSIDNCYLN